MSKIIFSLSSVRHGYFLWAFHLPSNNFIDENVRWKKKKKKGRNYHILINSYTIISTPSCLIKEQRFWRSSRKIFFFFSYFWHDQRISSNIEIALVTKYYVFRNSIGLLMNFTRSYIVVSRLYLAIVMGFWSGDRLDNEIRKRAITDKTGLLIESMK